MTLLPAEILGVIGLASDHAGFDIKQSVKAWLTKNGITYRDYGCLTQDSCDYPDFAHLLGDAIDRGEHSFGIAVCGSGEGISMTLNKHQKVRAALCWKTEIATLSRQHNNANVLVLPGRFISDEEAEELLQQFFCTPFEGGRHERRVNKIPLK